MDSILQTIIIIGLITCFGFFLRRIRIHTNTILKMLGAEVQIGRSSYRQFNTLYIILIASHLSITKAPISNFVNSHFAMGIFGVAIVLLLIKSLSWLRKAWPVKGACIAYAAIQLTMPLAIIGQLALFITAFSVAMLHARNYRGTRGMSSMQLD